MKHILLPGNGRRKVFPFYRIKHFLIAAILLTCINLHAQVRKPIFSKGTGTITATTGSNIVTGVGTLFTSELVSQNSIYWVGTSIGVVQSIQSNTQLTLFANASVPSTAEKFCYSEFTTADFTSLACAIKTYLDGHHYDYVMKHISPCNDPSDQPDDPDCASLSGVTRERIHQDLALGSPPAVAGINFLPWHRYFINELEEYFKFNGLSQFVPMPAWNPATPIPDVFFDPTVTNQCSEAEIIGTDWLDLPDINNQDITNIASSTTLNFWANRWSGLTTCNSATRQALSNSMGPQSGPHGGVHLAVVPVPFHEAPGYTWFYIWHAFADDVWRKWECTCTNNAAEQISGIDLFMQDRNSDEGLPMMESLDVGYEPFVTTKPPYLTEDIWVRNQQDGFTTDVHENPIAQPGQPVWVYVRVRNRSCTDYPGGGTLDLRWAKASTALTWPSNWDGTQTCGIGGPLMGDLIPSSTLQTIPAIVKGGHEIMEFEWYPPNNSDYNSCNPEPWHFCLLARILDGSDPMGTETWNLGQNVLDNNNIVWKNLTVIDQIPWMAEDGNDCLKGLHYGGVVEVGCPYDNEDRYDINFKLPVDIGYRTPITEAAEVKVVLDDVTWEKWATGGFQGQNVEIKNDGCHIVKVTGNPAILRNLGYNAHERSTVFVTFDFLADHPTATTKFNYQVEQTRTEDNAFIGGEGYQIVRPDRLPFYADAGADQTIAMNETTTLTAVDIGEPAIYNWYNLENGEVTSERVIEVSPNVNTQYELEVISEGDGFKCYDRVNVNIKPFAITSLNPNPATDQVTVEYYAEQASTASLVVMQPNNFLERYTIAPDAGSYNISLSDYVPGVYFVLLICDGNPADMKTVVIE